MVNENWDKKWCTNEVMEDIDSIYSPWFKLGKGHWYLSHVIYYVDGNRDYIEVIEMRVLKILKSVKPMSLVTLWVCNFHIRIPIGDFSSKQL